MKTSINSGAVAIIGGGPAGMSAALWCDELGLSSVLIEEEGDLGGQLRSIYNPIENYPGLTAQNGTEMLSRFEKSLGSRNFVRRTGIKATSIDVDAMEVRLADGESLACSAIILATGVRRRLLDIPGEIDLRGKGILESGSRDRHQVSGKRVIIVGGGDAAFENALILSEFAQLVSVAFRSNEPRARREFVDTVKSRENIELLPGTVVTRITGESWVKEVELKNLDGQNRSEPVDAVLIRIGFEPNSDMVRGVVELDELGFIKVDQTGRTNVPGIYAVGDVANNYSPTLSTAAGSSATAAKSILHIINNSKEV